MGDIYKEKNTWSIKHTCSFVVKEIALQNTCVCFLSQSQKDWRIPEDLLSGRPPTLSYSAYNGGKGNIVHNECGFLQL